MSYDPAEQSKITDIFADMLSSATADGGAKRQAGQKVDWRIDPGHEAAIFSHLNKWKHGEKVDIDSGAHPLVHLAWRALAIAYQETHREEATELYSQLLVDAIQKRPLFDGTNPVFPN